MHAFFAFAQVQQSKCPASLLKRTYYVVEDKNVCLSCASSVLMGRGDSSMDEMGFSSSFKMMRYFSELTQFVIRYTIYECICQTMKLASFKNISGYCSFYSSILKGK